MSNEGCAESGKPNSGAPPSMSNPFHVSNWPRPILDPADYQGGDRLCIAYDLGRLTDKEKKDAIKQWCVRLPELQGVRWLNIWSHVTPPIFEAACRIGNLECLQLKWSNVRHLDPIRNLTNLRYLFIGSSTKVESVEPLAALRTLQVLHIENFKRVTDFSPLSHLADLQSLAVIGSMWTRQRLGSLKPFAQMTWLKSLALDTAYVESILPLANLRNLEHLGLGGRLPTHEYAWLAAKLPDTKCRWFAPFIDLATTGIGRCTRCNRESKVMLTGRPTAVVCRFCDAARVKKREAQFIKYKQQATME